MAKKKPPKKQPSGRLPTGATNPSSSKQSSSASDSSSAAKSKKPSVSALPGSPTQTTQTPIPAHEVFIPILAIDTETPKSKTLATVNPIVPGSATHSLAPLETGKSTSPDKAPPPIAAQQSPADLWKGRDTRRIVVSCPWLPSRCESCKKFGHTISRCKSAPQTCETCNSVKHTTAACPRTNHLPPDLRKQKGKAPIKSLLPIVGPQKNSAVVRSSSEQSDHTVSTHHDLSK
ncbi:hypothetical protein F2Q70_00044551 [Brassica cretica]|uniref:Uncharacterized protein n=1 Tax=Brassica cretica TaxID=69181 RepID=A0A8S9KGH2_BRACR|nr:hypothetical protein F2Q70_00044551 [Brassica cretica]